MDDVEYVSASQAAKEAGVSEELIRHRCGRGKIRGAIKSGGEKSKWMIPKDEVPNIAFREVRYDAPDGFVTAKELADISGATASWVCHLCRTGELKTAQKAGDTGRFWIVSAEEGERWANEFKSGR